jgi:hypothetical protein
VSSADQMISILCAHHVMAESCLLEMSVEVTAQSIVSKEGPTVLTSLCAALLEMKTIKHLHTKSSEIKK